MILLAITVALVIVLIYIYWAQKKINEEYIEGLWVADPDFCEEADIGAMMMYIGPPIWSIWSAFSTERNAHIIIPDKDVNEPIKLTHGGLGGGKIVHFSASVEGSDGPVLNGLFPSHVSCEISLLYGYLKIYEGDTLYGLFYKNHEVTNMFK
jgi:hypothetical protein